MSISNTHCKNKHRCNVSPFPEEAGGNLLGVTFYSHRENLFPEPVSRWKSPVHMNKKKKLDRTHLCLFSVLVCSGCYNKVP